MELHIDDYWELVALHKSLMAAKFDDEPYLMELQGSPFTGSLAFKVFELLVKSCQSEGKIKEANDWLEWQNADRSRMETQLLLKRIKENSWWRNADCADREKYIVNFMSPLKLERELQIEITKNC